MATRVKGSAADKREAILEAASAAFATDGLERSSLRSIAAKAGYTPAALYFHFDSKEALFAELLLRSIKRLQKAVLLAAAMTQTPEEKIVHSGLGLFAFYANRPQELDLGFYLLRGQHRSDGLGPDVDTMLDAELMMSFQPIRDAAIALGADENVAELLVLDIFAYITGLLILLNTRRIETFVQSGRDRLKEFLDMRIRSLNEALNAD